MIQPKMAPVHADTDSDNQAANAPTTRLRSTELQGASTASAALPSSGRRDRAPLAPLTLGEERDDLLGRMVRVARVTNERDAEVFPPLIEAQLIHVDHHRMVTGVERDELTYCDRAQTWVLLSQDARRRAAARVPPSRTSRMAGD